MPIFEAGIVVGKGILLPGQRLEAAYAVPPWVQLAAPFPGSWVRCFNRKGDRKLIAPSGEDPGYIEFANGDVNSIEATSRQAEMISEILQVAKEKDMSANKAHSIQKDIEMATVNEINF